MIDWEEIIRTESTEELKEAKLWLFQENMRLQQERTELEQAKDKFLEERVTLRDELDALNRRTVMERKRLKEESLFFEKKMAILQDGFRQLEEDRKKLEKERRLLREEEVSPKASDEDGTENTLTVVQLLFRGVNNPLALRKRHSSSSAVNLALNALNIRVPNCVASSMRMAYVVTEMNALTANITFSHLDTSSI